MQNLTFFESQIQMPLVQLSLRSTRVQLKTATVLISPIRFTDADLSELKMTPPDAIVAPNNFHHLYVSKAKTQFPGARLYAAPGLQEKRADVAWDETLAAESWPHQDELPLVHIQGMPKYNEVVFFHRASKTLIVTDLLFNLQNQHGWAAKFVFGLMGTLNRPAVSRLFKLVTKNRAQARNSIKEILKFDFENIVMAHGEIIQGNGKQIFEQACRKRGLLP